MGLFGEFAKEFAKVAAKDFFTLGLHRETDAAHADPNCPRCNGRGHYGGLRALPGDPGSGVPPIECGCRKPEPPRNQRAAQEPAEAPSEARGPQLASLEAQLFSDGVVPGETPEEHAAWEGRVRAKRKRETAAGEMTLCCKRYCCQCGQNLRLRNGVPTRYPGPFLPGSVDEQQFHKAKAQYEADQATENANETTLPLPSMFGGAF
jgi:hypothetical protein